MIIGIDGRPSVDEYFMAMAYLVSSRGTCKRRRVGCVLVDENLHVIATGYNGVPSGFPHCRQGHEPCADNMSGEALHSCKAVHAEQNALIQCPDTDKIYAAYCTASPCVHCMKMLLNTSCGILVFAEEYPHHDALKMWTSSKRVLVRSNVNSYIKESER